jgi:DNA-binding GntR family transcriptional regulator
MSPGPTFERVYLELKRQLREGTRPPGAPLEPSAIGGELGTSFTPVRDALHRLVGEGLVENPLHNGFAVPRPTEQALRDLYAWNGSVLGLAASLRPVQPEQPLSEDAGVSDNAAAAARLFLNLAAPAGNRELIQAVVQLNELLAPYRRVEPQAIAEVGGEIVELHRLARAAGRPALTRALARYHKRRAAAAPLILASLLDRDPIL